MSTNMNGFGGLSFSRIRIVAVMPMHRDPDYWNSRVA